MLALVSVELFAFGVVLTEERADLAAKFRNYCIFGLSQSLEFFVFPAVEIVQAELEFVYLEFEMVLFLVGFVYEALQFLLFVCF